MTFHFAIEEVLSSLGALEGVLASGNSYHQVPAPCPYGGFLVEETIFALTPSYNLFNLEKPSSEYLGMEELTQRVMIPAALLRTVPENLDEWLTRECCRMGVVMNR